MGLILGRIGSGLMVGLLCFFVSSSLGAQETLDDALRKAQQGQGHLGKLLKGVSDRTLQSAESANLLVGFLETTNLAKLLEEVEGVSQLDVVIATFQNARGGPAIGVLTREGLPYLYRLSDELSLEIPDQAQDEYLFLMQLFAGYKTRDGSFRVMQAARKGLLPDHPFWPFVFDAFLYDHGDAIRVLTELSGDLPEGQIGMGVLDCSNALLAEGVTFKHPFDQDEGVRRFAVWLADTQTEDVAAAQSAVAALPFLKHPKRNSLLQAAVNHSHPLIKAEAGWALCKLGDRRGIRLLQSVARNVKYSGTARMYLEELGEEASIPREALEPAFLAKADLCQFLAHPGEFGIPPDQLEIVDTQSMNWPPVQRQETVWLIRVTYGPGHARVEPQSGVAFVGPNLAYEPDWVKELKGVDEVYGVYCALELSQKGDPRLKGKPTAEAGLELIRAANPRGRLLRRFPLEPAK